MTKLDYMSDDDKKAITHFVESNSHSPENEDSVEKDSILNTDRSVMEREIPDLTVCCKESKYNVVKDICIDGVGVPNLSYGNLDEKNACKFMAPQKDQVSKLMKRKVDVEAHMPMVSVYPEETFGRGVSSKCDSNNFMLEGAVRYETMKEIREDKDDPSKELFTLEDLPLVPDPGTENLDSKSLDNKSSLIAYQSSQTSTNEDHLRSLMVSQFGESNNCSGKVILFCPALAAAVEESNRNKEEVNLVSLGDASIFDFDSSTPATAEYGTEQCSQKFGFEPPKTGKTLDDKEVQIGTRVGPVDSSCSVSDSLSGQTSGNSLRLGDSGGQPSLQLDNGESSLSAVGHSSALMMGSSTRIENSNGLSISNHLQYINGETSFSSIGPVSGLISYSGPIAYSGSLSLRSEGSGTSARSFAFPVLQSEWNNSPVRMAKADQRKHRWRHNLLCCRF